MKEQAGVSLRSICGHFNSDVFGIASIFCLYSKQIMIFFFFFEAFKESKLGISLAFYFFVLYLWLL